MSAAAERRGATRAYDREVLVNVLVYHTRNGIRGCRCGWAVPGASFPEHVADVYEESVRTRRRPAPGGRPDVAGGAAPGSHPATAASELDRAPCPDCGHRGPHNRLRDGGVECADCGATFWEHLPDAAAMPGPDTTREGDPR